MKYVKVIENGPKLRKIHTITDKPSLYKLINEIITNKNKP